jgi:tRNA (cmo5U34)-methyltransferase
VSPDQSSGKRNSATRDAATSYSATAVWDAASYDTERRRMLADFDVFYGAAVTEVAGSVVPNARVLDLGAGTGLLSAQLLAARPDLLITMLDGDPSMMAKATSRLTPVHAVAAVHADLRDPLPIGPWDAIVSALAIHHLEDPDKRVLFTRIRQQLGPVGLFVNAEQILGPSVQLQARNMDRWESAARRLGSDDDEIARAHVRFRLDRSATVEEHLRWLLDAGFTDADCIWKHDRFAVIVGWA